MIRRIVFIAKLSLMDALDLAKCANASPDLSATVDLVAHFFGGLA